MPTMRSIILEAVKRIESDGGRADTIAARILADFNRHPKAFENHLYPASGDLHALPATTDPLEHSAFLCITVRHTRFKFRVTGCVVHTPEERLLAEVQGAEGVLKRQTADIRELMVSTNLGSGRAAGA